MPILTPTYPHQNSAFNVSVNTLKTIRAKMEEAKRQTQEILDEEERGTVQHSGSGCSWESSLFRNRHIFHEFEHFLIVIASAKTKNSVRWFGLIESRIRHFISNVEKEMTTSIARIWPKAFIRDCPERTNQLWFVGLEFAPQVFQDYQHVAHHYVSLPHYIKNRPGLNTALAMFRANLQTFASQNNYWHADMDFNAHYVHKTDLTSHLSEKDIMEIVEYQSQTRSPTPPPPLLQPSSSSAGPPCAKAAGTVTSNSKSDCGGRQKASNGGGYSSSSSYAAVVTNSNTYSGAGKGSDGGGVGLMGNSNGASKSQIQQQAQVRHRRY